MAATDLRTKRYCDRVEECLQLVANAQTPRTKEIHLLIAKHYLLLVKTENGWGAAAGPGNELSRNRILAADI
jgi:hypothetical protein